MSKILKSIFIITIISVAFVQVFYINKFNKTKNLNVYNTQNNIHKYKTLKEFNKELSCLKEANIISANQVNEKWNVKVKIQGNRDRIIEWDYRKLKKYDISGYTISRKEGKNFIIMEISDNESA